MTTEAPASGAAPQAAPPPDDEVTGEAPVLDPDDPRRDTVMTASFVRASLYTSVVSFGVAAFAFGLGLLLIIIGWALLRINRSLRAERT